MKVLVLYAHPAQQHSRVNKALCAVSGNMDGITFVDLYAKYPRLNIDIDAEQQRLLDHDAIIFQFPLMWYSTPSILKEWMDLVLEYGFAYGHDGNALKDKLWLNAVTAGAAEQSYSKDGHIHHNLRGLLSPLEATANLCKSRYLPPYAMFSALSADDKGELVSHCEGYKQLLEALRDDRFDIDAAQDAELLNATNIQNLIGAAK